jgi:aryl-alcohol dehydrogenase-like predicted oxidoreductase
LSDSIEGDFFIALQNKFHHNDRVLTAVQQLKPIAANLNLSMAQLALAWVLRDRRVASSIIGASRPSQVADNAAASGVSLSEDVLREIDQILEPALFAERTR